MSVETCAPERAHCDQCGEEHLYWCARLLLSRDPTNEKVACHLMVASRRTTRVRGSVLEGGGVSVERAM